MAVVTGNLRPNYSIVCARSQASLRTISRGLPELKLTVLYIGSSLLAPLKTAEREINRELRLHLQLKAHNFGATLTEAAWQEVESDLAESEVIFIIHVMDGENAARLLTILDAREKKSGAVVVINCMPDLMRRTRMGRLDFERLAGRKSPTETTKNGSAMHLLGTVGSWLGTQAKARRGSTNSHTKYLKLADRLPGILRFVPGTGALGDAKNYLSLFCYFLQPTPTNIQSMILSALKHYSSDQRLRRVQIPPPQTMPTVAIYHPDAPKLFDSFERYSKWYRARTNGVESLNSDQTIGLLLMRPQVISKATKHYDQLIRAIEAEGLSVVPVLATLMDNREACEKFFVQEADHTARTKNKVQSAK